jgi:hypothetical protein
MPRSSLVATRLAAAARALKLTALLAHIRLDVAVRNARGAEVLDGLAAVAGPAEEDAVGARRRAKRELVKRDALPTRLHVWHTIFALACTQLVNRDTVPSRLSACCVTMLVCEDCVWIGLLHAATTRLCAEPPGCGCVSIEREKRKENDEFGECGGLSTHHPHV